MAHFKGIIVASCTPFTDDGEQVDETAYKKHIDAMLEAGCHNFLACAGTDW